MSNQKIIFSGIQPSGSLHLGNYLGAISQWVEMENDYHCFFSIVDYHAITVPGDPEVLRKKIIEVAKIYLASGLNPAKTIIFKQSDVNEHTELAWVLGCLAARFSDLKKMTQFKDKSLKHQENVSVGLFEYPVLMAADILLYDTDVVPVGDDQVQHVELARDLAKRFNNAYGSIFKIPEFQIRKTGARIMSLFDPLKKMSKSDDNAGAYLALSDSPEIIEKKIKKAVTDSGSDISYDLKKRPAISNLLTIYSLVSGLSIEALVKKYQGQGYGVFKTDLALAINNYLAPIQKKYASLSDQEVLKVLELGAKEAKKIANQKMLQVKKAIGTL